MNKEEIELLNKIDTLANQGIRKVQFNDNGGRTEYEIYKLDEIRLNSYSAKIINDYIIQLQQRIEKAIEYICNNSTRRKIFADIFDEYKNSEPKFYGNIKDLLEILKGE